MKKSENPQSVPRGEGRKAGRRAGNAPTINDVALAAGCSPMTVSRVINGNAKVSDTARQAVNRAIQRLNYSPNRAARSLAGGEQTRIAVLFENPSSSYLGEFLFGALAEASRSDFQIIVRSSENRTATKSLVRHLAEGGIQGFVLPPPLCDDQCILDLVVDLNAIAIAVGPSNATQSQGAVLVDDIQAAYDLTRHIISLGHERIGFIKGNPEQVATGRRLKGYLKAMRDAGLQIDKSLIVQGQFTYRSGMDGAEKLLSVDPRPTAIFASNDDMAVATIAVAQGRHLDVPKDITVCGFDDTEMASSIWPELTTIRQPIREMAAWAINTMESLIRAKRHDMRAPTITETIPHKLVRRASDAAPSLTK